MISCNKIQFQNSHKLFSNYFKNIKKFPTLRKSTRRQLSPSTLKAKENTIEKNF